MVFTLLMLHPFNINTITKQRKEKVVNKKDDKQTSPEGVDISNSILLPAYNKGQSNLFLEDDVKHIGR